MPIFDNRQEVWIQSQDVDRHPEHLVHAIDTVRQPMTVVGVAGYRGNQFELNILKDGYPDGVTIVGRRDALPGLHFVLEGRRDILNNYRHLDPSVEPYVKRSWTFTQDSWKFGEIQTLSLLLVPRTIGRGYDGPGRILVYQFAATEPDAWQAWVSDQCARLQQGLSRISLTQSSESSDLEASAARASSTPRPANASADLALLPGPTAVRRQQHRQKISASPTGQIPRHRSTLLPPVVEVNLPAGPAAQSPRHDATPPAPTSPSGDDDDDEDDDDVPLIQLIKVVQPDIIQGSTSAGEASATIRHPRPTLPPPASTCDDSDDDTPLIQLAQPSISRGSTNADKTSAATRLPVSTRLRPASPSDDDEVSLIHLIRPEIRRGSTSASEASAATRKLVKGSKKQAPRPTHDLDGFFPEEYLRRSSRLREKGRKKELIFRRPQYSAEGANLLRSIWHLPIQTFTVAKAWPIRVANVESVIKKQMDQLKREASEILEERRQEEAGDEGEEGEDEEGAQEHGNAMAGDLPDFLRQIIGDEVMPTRLSTGANVDTVEVEGGLLAPTRMQSPRPASPRPASPRPASPRPASPRPTSPRQKSPPKYGKRRDIVPDYRLIDFVDPDLSEAWKASMEATRILNEELAQARKKAASKYRAWGLSKAYQPPTTRKRRAREE